MRDIPREHRYDVSVAGHDLTFHTTWGIFSPKDMDKGTALLLQYLELKEGMSVFDLGCAYGALGISIAKQLHNTGEVHMVDTNMVALKYCLKNIAQNKVSNCVAYLSNGFEEVPKEKEFDLVVSNIPAKVGRELMHLFLQDAKAHLKPGGTIQVVVIAGLRDFMKNNLKEHFGNYKKVKESAGYAILKARKE